MADNIVQIHKGDLRAGQLYEKLENVIIEFKEIGVPFCAAIGAIELLKHKLILESLQDIC